MTDGLKCVGGGIINHTNALPLKLIDWKGVNIKFTVQSQQIGTLTWKTKMRLCSILMVLHCLFDINNKVNNLNLEDSNL